MRTCPHCGATLPDFAAGCQFCHTSFAPTPGVGARPATRPGAGGRPRWVVPAYHAIAGFWVLSGAYDALKGTVLADGEVGGLGMMGAAVGGLTAVIGFGLLVRLEAARGIVNVLSAIQILDGLLGVVVAFGLGGLTGLGVLAISVLRVAAAGMMIFLIGETETRAPGF